MGMTGSCTLMASSGFIGTILWAELLGKSSLNNLPVLDSENTLLGTIGLKGTIL